ncbi:MAG: type I DNA topoisomerase [Clostridia bacterium]|nr:type I DNA topoisomerase [Clostridia bacterium]MBO4429474.1 type I DNA topoisomerase [Clostridia bacterium]
MSKLIIIESPSKAPAIMSYLGKGYKVLASKGHVRDLPKSTLGVDIKDGFKPKYITIQGKNDVINLLKKEAKTADAVYFATDPDREGEAISWHIATVLGMDPAKCLRISFNEITKSTIQAEINNPRPIDMNLVDAQQARRVLDRIVGYQLSPYLWKTIKSGLSAGRVQSVATRLIVERDAEIDAFVPKEYYTIDAILKTSRRAKINTKFYGDENGKIELASKEDADAVISACADGEFTANYVKKAKKSKSPLPPFETATLQQDASHRLGFSSKKIMRVAQELYEGVDIGKDLGGAHGLITYMRTDSLRISDEASAAAREFIVKNYGKEFYPPKPRFFKSKSEAQDAHEAIRPANVAFTPEMLKGRLSSDQYKLYKLIWERFVASQMKNAEFDTVSAEFECNGYVFRSNESSVAFKGYLTVYDDTDEKTENDGKLANVKDGDKLVCEDIASKQNFTEPPPRYNEGSLVKVLKEKGIGRPSTYAQTITTIIDRGYVTLEKKAFKSTPLGKASTEIMKKNFPKIVDYRFTADVETSLDEIADGEKTFVAVLEDFYDGFEKTLDEAQKHLKENRVKIPDEESDIVCEKCGRKMVIKTGKYGKFAACPGYPECKNTKPLVPEGKKAPAEKKEAEKTDLLCEKCGSPLLIRSSKYGKFYACSAFPKCRYTKAIREEIGVPCPKCGAPIIKNFGKKAVFYSCSRYPDCDFSVWDRPTNEKCPECGSMLALKENKNVLVCVNKDCKFKKDYNGGNEK